MTGGIGTGPLLRAAGLCFVAGYVDAVGYTELGGVFAANMTGNSVLLAIAAARGEWPRAASYALTLFVFLLGAIVASALRRRTAKPVVSLIGSAALLVIAALAPLEPLLRLAFLAAAMGMQGAALTRFGPTTLQTVVVTGTMVRLADALVARVLPVAPEPTSADTMRLDGIAWTSYILGAAGTIAVRRVMERPLLLAALVLLLVAVELLREPEPKA
jgi:uncharacterized membrane protein YoaK (UPF0700 family)